MRILIQGINYAPEITGVGKYSGEVGEWLAGRGHEVRVVTAPPYYPQWRIGEGYSAGWYRRERVAGAEVWRCPLWIPAKPSGFKRLLHLASFAASSLPAMLRQVAWRPDVVVLVEPPLFSAPGAWLTAALCRAKTWLHVQDFELDAAMRLGILGGHATRRVMYEIEGNLLRRAGRVSTITEAMRRRAAEKGVPDDRTTVFPNWSDVELVRPMQPDPVVRRNFGAGPGDVLVMHAGNMGEKQGLDLVLDAADTLRDRKEIKFAMIGTGAARGRLERAVIARGLRNVRFFELQPTERLPLVLAAGDVHLIVQRREAADLVMPSKLTNILAAGRASVATADPGTALYDVLNSHGCGVVTTPGDVGGLVAGIVELAKNAEKREVMGRNARRYAERHLAKDAILETFEGELIEMVGSTSSPHRNRSTLGEEYAT